MINAIIRQNSLVRPSVLTALATILFLIPIEEASAGFYFYSFARLNSSDGVNIYDSNFMPLLALSSDSASSSIMDKFRKEWSNGGVPAGVPSPKLISNCSSSGYWATIVAFTADFTGRYRKDNGQMIYKTDIDYAGACGFPTFDGALDAAVRSCKKKAQCSSIARETVVHASGRFTGGFGHIANINVSVGIDRGSGPERYTDSDEYAPLEAGLRKLCHAEWNDVYCKTIPEGKRAQVYLDSINREAFDVNALFNK